eukprot:TRINITY_DN14144_c0_g1_i3.p1 TRINITY_DN14144_c0_g1~~TRINITY_DN14144_c0_g1_i3.p1  ORF type:complete len:323 (-),score=116.79 TRINITY_DN14144_c0_g1_i3:33-1001(-)
MKDYQDQLRTPYDQLEPPYERLKNFERHTLIDVDKKVEEATKSPEAKAEKKIRPPTATARYFNVPSSDITDRETAATNSVMQPPRYQGKVPRPVGPQMYADDENEEHPPVFDHQDDPEIRSNYMFYKPTNRAYEVEMEKRWVDNRNKELAEKKLDEEFISVMQQWSAAKGRFAEESQRKAEALAFGNRFLKRQFVAKPVRGDFERESEEIVQPQTAEMVAKRFVEEVREEAKAEEGEEDEEEEEDGEDEEEDDQQVNATMGPRVINKDFASLMPAQRISSALTKYSTEDIEVRVQRDKLKSIRAQHEPVSYTHLTLPTIYSV